MTAEAVTCAVEAHVALVRLNRPEKLNAINDEMFEGLLRITADLAGDTAVRAVVLTGQGRGFCAGLDLSSFRSFLDESERGERSFSGPEEGAPRGRRPPGRGQVIVTRLREMPIPVIAALHGAVVGGGLQLCLGADIRYVTPDARLGLRELDFGISPDMGATQLLPRLIGPDRAMELALSGKLISGEEAAAIGLATRTAPDPLDAALELARTIAGRNPAAVSFTKMLVLGSETMTVGEGLRAELRAMAHNVGSPAQSEAAAAFFDKRAPRFDPRPDTAALTDVLRLPARTT